MVDRVLSDERSILAFCRNPPKLLTEVTIVSMRIF